ncbi:MAG: hypothetical protein IKR00_05090 [Lachnospiraceae bacterium]|nr:hypothetical protein [Lachnospiraceae bacterium]
MKKKEKEFSNQLMAFTFFFAVVIYLLFLGFHYWNLHSEDKKNLVE